MFVKKGRKARVALPVVFLCVINVTLFGSSVQAQVLTHDAANNETNLAGFAKQLAQSVKQYETEFQTLQNMLVTAQSLGLKPSVFSGKLTPISDSSKLIAAACPGANGVSPVSDIINSIAAGINPNQSIVSAQQAICARITQLKVDQFNLTAEFYNKTSDYSDALQKLTQLADSANSLGSSSAAQTQANQYAAALQHDTSEWQSHVGSNEAIIKSLEQQQSILAQVALRGSNTVLGNVVQAATLKAALDVK